MRKISKIFKKPITYFVTILSFAIVFISQKIAYLSADPNPNDDCLPTSDQGQTAQQSNQINLNDPYGPLEWSQKGGFINDASCLNKTAVYGVVTVTKQDDITQALTFANQQDIPVSLAGVRHSMGGQAFYKNAVVLDMKHFNQMSLDKENSVLTVQSGATWHDIQNFLHPKHAVKAMQSTDIFTVGGSISVNAHGMDHHAGSVANTIKSMNIMLADGQIVTVSSTKNKELFDLVVGGYGLFGVILDVQLEIIPNEVYDYHEEVIATNNFLQYFKEKVLAEPDVKLFYGHLSTSPNSFLDEMIVYVYKKSATPTQVIPPLEEPGSTKLKRLILNFSKVSSFGKQLKWFSEKKLSPLITACTLSRNQALVAGESCLVSRNEPMHDSVKYLQNNLENDTDILLEYFIPQDEFLSFVSEMKNILNTNQANLLNASVRVVHKEDNLLTYAPQDEMLAIVLYVNATTDDEGVAHLKRISEELVDLSTKKGGRFFLPYQLNYSAEQLQKAYPEIADFFSAKKKYDPQVRLTNTFYETYQPLITQ